MKGELKCRVTREGGRCFVFIDGIHLIVTSTTDGNQEACGRRCHFSSDLGEGEDGMRP